MFVMIHTGAANGF